MTEQEHKKVYMPDKGVYCSCGKLWNECTHESNTNLPKAKPSKKICPIMMSREGGPYDCQESKCAWWRPFNHACAIVTIAILLNVIAPK